MFFNSYFYYITIGLQIICVVHCLKKGNQNWIWIIIFIPLVGCIAYVIMEMLNRSSVRNVQSGVGNIFYPAGKIKKLEQQLQFADTFNNRVLLADAYLATGKTNRAIELYENSLTGAFKENEHVLIQLVIAYFEVGRYHELISIAKKLYNNPLFKNSHANVIYAMALYKTGEAALAESEFKKMKIRYSYFEARYQYGLFLLGENRMKEAEKIWEEVINEFSYLSSFEKRNNRFWYNCSRNELKKLSALVAQN